jgi:hypothetical protein
MTETIVVGVIVGAVLVFAGSLPAADSNIPDYSQTERSQVPAEFKFNVTDLFKDEAAWRTEFEALAKLIASVDGLATVAVLGVAAGGETHIAGASIHAQLSHEPDEMGIVHSVVDDEPRVYPNAVRGCHRVRVAADDQVDAVNLGRQQQVVVEAQVADDDHRAREVA